MDFKKYGILAGIAVALVLGGFAAGRYAVPAKVVVTEKVVTVHETQIVREVDTDKVLAAINNVSQQKDVHRTKVTVKGKDGTVTTTETTDDKSKTDTQTKTQEEDKSKTAETKTEIQVVEKEVTKTVVSKTRSDWSLSLQPGIDVAGALGHGSPYTILPTDQFLLKHAIVGVSVEHRLFGPVSTGIWGNTSGAAGLTLRIDL